MASQKNPFDKFSQDAGVFGREASEAVSKASAIYQKNCETILKACMSFTQDTIEKQTQYAKKALSTKTLNEFTELQSEAAQESFNDFMTGATRISELCVKAATDCIEPINDQLGKTIRKASEAMAA